VGSRGDVVASFPVVKWFFLFKNDLISIARKRWEAGFYLNRLFQVNRPFQAFFSTPANREFETKNHPRAAEASLISPARFD
jgi:hypothetical protein